MKSGNYSMAGETQEQRAERLAQAGDYAGAAYLFERIAGDRSGDSRTKDLLTAADYYLLANDLYSARRIMQSLDGIDSSKFPLYPVIRADLLLRNGNTSAALLALGQPPGSRDDYLSYRYYATLARIQMQADNRRAALDTMLQLDGSIRTDNWRLANQRAIIALLSGLQVSERQQLMIDNDPVVAGWAILADILNHSMSLPDRNTRLAAWKTSYPSHPALRQLYEADMTGAAGSVGDIAVLLPISGVYARAATAIRQGIEMTHSMLPPERRPALTYIDSTDISSALSQAQNADLILGPLTKEAVETVISGGSSGKTMITLNQASDYSPGGILQFGLSTSAEGAMIADKAWQDGLRSAAIIYPNASWGTRYFEGFRERWESLGGYVAGSISYDQNEKDFSALMKSLMQNGGDFVFIVAKPVTARQIRQQVGFYGSAGTPVYAASTAYDRRLYGVQDRDFNNVKVPVLRWTVPGQSVPGVPDWESFKATGNFDPALAKFYALGIDGLLVAINNETLSNGGSVTGATGDLRVSMNGIIQPVMFWLYYQDGIPVPLYY
ncbi:MAG: penicillin-binding protein activator [Gammaproteobacteria bacterium]